MNGDIVTNEILRAVGGLETAVQTLSIQVADLTKDLKPIGATCQSFEHYKEERKELPERIAALERTAQDYINEKKDREELRAKVDFLASQYQKAMIAAAVINAVALFLIWVGSYLVSKGYLRIGP